MSRYRHPALQRSSATKHLNVAACTSRRRVIAVPPHFPRADAAPDGLPTRTDDSATLAGHRAETRADNHDAVSFTICSIVRAAG